MRSVTVTDDVVKTQAWGGRALGVGHVGSLLCQGRGGKKKQLEFIILRKLIQDLLVTQMRTGVNVKK